MKKIKILHIINSLGLGGIQRQLSEVVAYLPEDYENHILSFDDNDFFHNRIKENVRTVTTVKRTPLLLFKVLYCMLRVVYKERPDIIHVWNIYTLPFVAFIRLFIPFKVKIINGTLREAPIHMPFPKRLISFFFFSIFRYTISNSKAGYRAFGLPRHAGSYVLHNGFSFSRIPDLTQSQAREELGLPPEKFIVTIAAALGFNKDHETFIKAALLIEETGVSDIIFLIVGDGPKRSLLEEFAKGHDSIRFLGGRNDVEKIFVASDLSVLTSAAHHGEGISNSIVEALACGKPVIATDNGGTSEVVINGENGYVIPCGDTTTLVKYILKLKEDDELSGTLARNAKQMVLEKFSISTMIDNLTLIYHEVLEISEK